jgi:hypothetical protein
MTKTLFFAERIQCGSFFTFRFAHLLFASPPIASGRKKTYNICGHNFTKSRKITFCRVCSQGHGRLEQEGQGYFLGKDK